MLFIYLGVTVSFTNKAYGTDEDKQALPEIVVSSGDITEPITIR